MKSLHIPPTAEAYQEDILARAFPDERIVQNDFYRRLIGWVMDVRTPLLYEQTHPDEYTNLSINFNWLLLRDYCQTKFGAEPTVRSLYSLHEFTHMTHWLPTRLDLVSAAEYAEQFTGSEYRASNESEILAHYRIPELRGVVFPGMRLAVDMMKARGIARPPSQLLGHARALLVEHREFDGVVADDPAARPILDRLKYYGGNRAWARRHYEHIRERFSDPSLPQSDGLTDAEYESTIAGYEPNLNQTQYEANVIRNVRFAFAMCGQPVPFIANFKQALAAAEALEGRHALV